MFIENERTYKNEIKYCYGRTRNTTKYWKYSKNMCSNWKRAGLDYWDKLEIEKHDSLEKFLEKYKPEKHNMFMATTKAEHCYTDIDYSKFKDEEIFVLFGKETKGLPEDLLQKYIDKTIM